MAIKDEALARRAAAGDASAFATLYDRYERRTYNLCYRITGSPHDAADATQETFLKVLERLPRLEGRELNFGAYVMTAARNASYDAIERRKRAVPTDDLPEVALDDDRELPERTALRSAHQEQIRAANEGLPPRQREVLALRELEDLSYGEVAQIMGMNQNSVAQLISRARINLRDGLRQTALGSVASASPQCDRALPLLAMHQDGVLEDPWLVEHLMECGACRVRLEAMEEAAVAYRQWLLVVPALWLREETAEAAERVNSGWSRRLLAGAGATLAVVLALAFLAADWAQTPTRVFAPAPTPEAEPVVERVAAAPAEPKAKKKKKKKQQEPRKVVARKPASKPRAVERTAPESSGERTVVAAVPVPTADAPAPKPRARPRREPRPKAPVVTADPPPVAEEPVAPPEPPVVVDTSTPPAPPCPAGGPSCTGGTPPTPPCSSVRCPPPPRVTCTTCGIVAPPPAPPRRPPPTTRTP